MEVSRRAMDDRRLLAALLRPVREERVRSRLAPDAGTTLIETLVVVGITALVAFIGFPKMQQAMLAMSQRETVSMVAARLREARAQALSSDQPVVFAVTADGRTFGVLGERAPGKAAPGVSVAPADGSPRQIVFYGDGTSSGGVILVRGGQRASGVATEPQNGAVALIP